MRNGVKEGCCDDSRSNQNAQIEYNKWAQSKTKFRTAFGIHLP